MTDAATEGMQEEREQTQFRQQYYGLLAGLLSREPSAEMLDVLRTGIDERVGAARELHPLLGEGWQRLREVLPSMTAEAAEEEFLKLFIGPFQPEVTPYESWYLTGQLFQAPLMALRGFLHQIGLERKEENFSEPEDVLAFELEVMSWLVTKQLDAGSPEETREWLHRQSAFLTQHLLIWGPACAEALQYAKSASLFKGAALLLRGLLGIERQRLQGAGVREVETVDQAKRRYGSPRAYQGPLFDPNVPSKPKGTPSSGEPKA